MTAQTILKKSLKLPSGLTITNRLAKAAMTEGLASTRGVPSEGLNRLYKGWAQGGAGLLITGNVMVDPKHLERPGNVVLGGKPDKEAMAALKAWVKTAKQDGAAFLMQISHAGRQTPKKVNQRPLAPSAIPVNLPGGQFGYPRAMTISDIEDAYQRFVTTADVAKQAGFDGVQVHAAHGYLLSQFLSPRSNQRVDEYGGSLENRARLLRRIVQGIRKACGKDFTLSVKLNSADFQRGGFDFDEALKVAQWLEKDGIDLLEISGGTYEQPRMMKIDGNEPVVEPKQTQSTKEREAYFLDFAAAMRKKIKLPMMVTGGFRSAEAMAEAVSKDKIDLIGLARPLVVDADAVSKLLTGKWETLDRWETKLKGQFGAYSAIPLLKTIAGFAMIHWFYAQFLDIAEGRMPDRRRGIYRAFFRMQMHERRWMEIWRRKGPAVTAGAKAAASAKPARKKAAAAPKKTVATKKPATAKKPAAAKKPVAKKVVAKKAVAKAAPAPATAKTTHPAPPAKTGTKPAAKTSTAAPKSKIAPKPKAAPRPKAVTKPKTAAKQPVKAAAKPAVKPKTDATPPQPKADATPPKPKPAVAPKPSAETPSAMPKTDTTPPKPKVDTILWPGKAAVLEILQAQAKTGNPFGYGDAVKAMGRAWAVTDKPKLEKDLVAISADARAKGEPDLAILVQSGKGVPGTAYFKALPDAPKDEAAKKAFVAAEIAKIKAKYSAG